jgi:uncharacterized surface protein with fasciclin (FAS1) repeats
MSLMVAAGALAGAQMKTKMVGGAEMFPAKNIIENAMNSKDHTTLVAAVKAAGLVDTLSGAGPFTVGKLWAWMKGRDLILTDEKGGMAKVTIADVYQSNGVIHVVDTVVMPN